MVPVWAYAVVECLSSLAVSALQMKTRMNCQESVLEKKKKDNLSIHIFLARFKKKKALKKNIPLEAHTQKVKLQWKPLNDLKMLSLKVWLCISENSTLFLARMFRQISSFIYAFYQATHHKISL